MNAELCWQKWALVAAKNTKTNAPYLPKKSTDKLREQGLLLGVLAGGQRVVVVSNRVLYLGPDLSWGQIWADHPLLPTMPSHNREQSSWQMLNHKSCRLFPKGCNRQLIRSSWSDLTLTLSCQPEKRWPTKNSFTNKKGKHQWNLSATYYQLGTFQIFWYFLNNKSFQIKTSPKDAIFPRKLVPHWSQWILKSCYDWKRLKTT